MSIPRFFAPPRPLSLGEVARLTNATLEPPDRADRVIHGLGPLDTAAAGEVSFLDNAAYAHQAAATRAEACFVAPRQASRVVESTARLVTPEPYRAFARLAGALYPGALRPQPVFSGEGVAPGAFIHPLARLEPGVTIDPGVVVGPGAEVGSGTVICAGAVIGPEVRIGRDAAIGAGAVITHTLMGNRVIVQPRALLGQDGFGFAMGPKGHLKVPQVGRVIVQDDVEIGAGTTIDRGMNRDTIVGEGTKIDNLVQIAHNVVIGRHCVIVAQVGIAGSARLEDFVVVGGQTGIIGHVTIGMGAQIAASSAVARDVPRGARWGGTPARPVKELFRQMTALDRLARGGPAHAPRIEGEGTKG